MLSDFIFLFLFACRQHKEFEAHASFRGIIEFGYIKIKFARAGKFSLNAIMPNASDTSVDWLIPEIMGDSTQIRCLSYWSLIL